jgi:hypothetical protein
LHFAFDVYSLPHASLATEGEDMNDHYDFWRLRVKKKLTRLSRVTFTYEQQEQEYYVKTPVPVS